MPPVVLLKLSVVVIVVAFCSPALAAEKSGRLANGDSFKGSLLKVDEGLELHFAVDSATKSVPADELVFWGNLRDTDSGTHVLLADGGVIVASDVRMEDERLVIEANLFGQPEGFAIAGTARLPLSAVQAIVFRVPLDPLKRDLLMDRAGRAAGNEDQLLLANGDMLSGTVKSLDRVKRRDGAPGPLAVTMTTQAGEITIEPDKPEGRLLDRVTALFFNPLLVRKVRPEGIHLLVGFDDGSRLYVKGIEPRGEQATLTLVCGAMLPSHPDVKIWNEISHLQTLGAATRYVSDLKGAGYKQVPLLELTWPLHNDRNVLGGRFRAGGDLYERGLGMHSASRIVYALDQPYRRLEAELAIDESAGRGGSVVFLVLADAGGSFKPIYKSPVVRGGQKPIAMSVDLSGARRIALFVEAADRGTELDRANWLNARLMKDQH